MMEEKATEDLTDFDPADTVPDKVEDSQSAEESRESLRKQRDDLRDRWLRKEAEIQNLRKRVARERTEMVDSVRASVLQTILPVIDSSEKGIDLLEDETQSGNLQVYRDGIQLLVKELKALGLNVEMTDEE